MIAQSDEGRHAATRQDAVIDLQHEQRAGQHQEVDQPLNTAMPMNAPRHDVSAPRSSDPASSVEEEWPICTAGVTGDSSVKNAFEGAG